MRRLLKNDCLEWIDGRHYRTASEKKIFSILLLVENKSFFSSSMQARGNYKYTQNTIPRTEGKRNDLVLTDVGGRILKLNFLKGGVNILNGLIEIEMCSSV